MLELCHLRGALGCCRALLRCSLWPLAARLGAVLTLALARSPQHKAALAQLLPLLHQHLLLGHLTVTTLVLVVVVSLSRTHLLLLLFSTTITATTLTFPSSQLLLSYLL